MTAGRARIPIACTLVARAKRQRTKWRKRGNTGMDQATYEIEPIDISLSNPCLQIVSHLGWSPHEKRPVAT